MSNQRQTSNGMDISLVICAHNEEKYIGACLDAAIQNSRGRFKEIIVVDNASTDKTAEIARTKSGVRVVREEKKGLTFARQAGLEATNSELVAYTDADTLLPVGWMDIVEGVFESPSVVSLSGPARYFDGSFIEDAVMGFFWRGIAPLTYRAVGYMVYGANFVAKRSALLAIGGFDRSIEFYGEDTDIARRLATQGKSIFRADFFIYTSARRLQHEGLIRANTTYAMNYLWPVLFKRPYHSTHRDIRT